MAEQAQKLVVTLDEPATLKCRIAPAEEIASPQNLGVARAGDNRTVNIVPAEN